MSQETMENRQDLFSRGYLLERYLKDLGVSKFVRNVERASQGQSGSLNEPDSLIHTPSVSSPPDDIGNTSPCSWGDHGMTCPMDKSTYFTYKKRAALDLHDLISYIYVQSKLPEATSDDLGQPQTNTLQPSKDEVFFDDNITVELRIVRTLLMKLWIGCHDPSPTSVIEDRGSHNSRGQQSNLEDSKKKADSSGSLTLMSSQSSSKGAQKHPRQPTRAPDSKGESDDGDSKKPDGAGFRGRRPRMPNEFACPFFKHDPDKHGKRGGCRDYSHQHVSILLRDHIGTKHLRNNDLDETMWLQLKQITNRRGAARYQEIYKKLFPGDEVGVRNPYFEEYTLPASWLERAPDLRNAEFVATTTRILDLIDCLEEEKTKQEAQIRSHAEVNIIQIQRSHDMETPQSTAAAIQKIWQICNARDEQLKEIRVEMRQRRQQARALVESIVHGQPLGALTNPGTPLIVADPQHLIATDRQYLARVDQRYSNETETAVPISTNATSNRNAQISSKVGAFNSTTSNPGFLFVEATQPEPPSTLAPTLQNNYPGLDGRDNHMQAVADNHLVPSAGHLLGDSASYLPCCYGSCHQGHNIWCSEFFGEHC